jgi:dolichol-phosphate mannosyltransferase
LILKETYTELKNVLGKNADSFNYEIILVDDGSGDDSYRVMKEISSIDKNVKLIKLSRNFGSYLAILAGMNYATGDAITYLAADLQDPPELVPQMYNKWLEGCKKNIICAVRSGRSDPILSRLFSFLFYKIFRTFVFPEYPQKGFDCFFINKEQKEILIKMDEKNSHLTAQIIWLGFKPIYIHYQRAKREKGKSRWTFFKKFKLAFDTFFGFSGRPLRIASLLGMAVSILGFLLALFIIIRRFTSGTPLLGIPSLMVSILIIGGFILLSIGIVGEYLWRNFDATRNRPSFIVEETLNC